jgi:hypothetical protein
MERTFIIKIQTTGEATVEQVFEQLRNFELTLDIYENDEAVMPFAEAVVTLHPVKPGICI